MRLLAFIAESGYAGLLPTGRISVTFDALPELSQKRQAIACRSLPSMFLLVISSTGGGGRNIAVSPTKTTISDMPGAQTGAIDSDSDSQGQLMRQALDELQRAWKSLRRFEDLSDDPAESKAAGRAVAFVDKAFAALEGGG